MILTKQLSRQVAGDVQQRGRQYHARRAVTILEGDAWSVRALVQGGSQYEVSLTREGRQLQVFCSCPYYQDRLTPCKHIWATVLAAEERGYLIGPGGTARLRVVDDEEAYYQWRDDNGPQDQEDWGDE